MRYYKMKITDARTLGIPTFGHLASDTLVIVGDGDLRRATGFGDTVEVRERLSLTPLTDTELFEARHDKAWAFSNE